MICLKCDTEAFVLHPEAEVEQEYRGETFHVTTPVVVCSKCGWQTLAEGQMDELGRRTADAYRKKHGLLTSSQIKALRLALGMSQRAFAEFLRVGEASVKRWENWQVQDASSDELIRVKCVMAKKGEALARLRAEVRYLRNPPAAPEPAAILSTDPDS